MRLAPLQTLLPGRATLPTINSAQSVSAFLRLQGFDDPIPALEAGDIAKRNRLSPRRGERPRRQLAWKDDPSRAGDPHRSVPLSRAEPRPVAIGPLAAAPEPSCCSYPDVPWPELNPNRRPHARPCRPRRVELPSPDGTRTRQQARGHLSVAGEHGRIAGDALAEALCQGCPGVYGDSNKSKRLWPHLPEAST